MSLTFLLTLTSPLVVTDDFEDSICFKEGMEYQLAYREPSSPNTPTGVALWGIDDDDGLIHCGWVKENGRQPIDRCLKAGKVVRGKVLRMTNRWEQYCDILERRRKWQGGEMLWWCNN